jgi:hypothetical protein
MNGIIPVKLTHYLSSGLSWFSSKALVIYIFKVRKLEAQWAEPVSLTCWINQKQELPMVAMLVN